MKILKNTLYLEKEERFINLNNVIMITKISQGDRSKIAFNFENVVSQKNSADGTLIPDFHYIFGNEKEINEIFSELASSLKNTKFVEINSANGYRLINPSKINSFFVDKDKGSLYLNFNSSISTFSDFLGTMSVKCIVDSKNSDEIINKIIENIEADFKDN